MQVPGSDILWLEFISVGKETLLEKKKVNGTMLRSNYCVNNFVSKCNLSLRRTTFITFVLNGVVSSESL